MLAILDRLEQQVLERDAVEQFAEHVIDTAAQRLARSLQLFEQPRVNLAFAGIRRDEIPEVANLGLADAVDAAEPLLDLVRVPRQIVVDHEVAALKVHTLAGRVVGDQDQHVLVLHEALDDLAPLFTRNAAVDHLHGLGIAEPRPHLVEQVVQRVLGLGENDQLAAIAGRVDHQIVVEDTIELAPLRIHARAQHAERHRLQALQRLDFQGELLDRLGRRRARGDQILKLVDLFLAIFLDVAQHVGVDRRFARAGPAALGGKARFAQLVLQPLAAALEGLVDGGWR